MDRLETYKEWYYKELERKDNLEDSLNFPFGIVSALIAVWYYYFSNFDFSEAGINKYFFLILMGLSLLIIILSVAFLLTSYFNIFKKYTYWYLPGANKVDKYYESLIQWHSDPENKSSAAKGEEEFKAFLISTYRDATDNDAFQNKRKTAFLYRGKSFLYYGFLSLIIVSICFGFNSYNKEEKDGPVHKVEIVNSK